MFSSLLSEDSSFLSSDFSPVPSAAPSSVVSSVLVSTSTVGGTKVAITKSLSDIVGATPSGS